MHQNVLQREVKNVKKIIISVFTISMLLAGCGQSQNKEISQRTPITAPLEHPAITPANTKVIGTIREFSVNTNNRLYKITLQKVNKVGKEYAYVNTATNGPGGYLSTVLPSGAILYEIPGIDPSQALAVKWKGQYVEVVRTNK